jgi:diacylglycerol kinase (ATP)
VTHFIFIVNPAAKNGFSLQVWNKIKNKLVYIPHEVFFTERAGHATEIVKEIGLRRWTESDNPLIVTVGGDGTIHEVLNGLIDYPHISCAFIPAGSGNDFAKGFAIKGKPSHVLESIINGPPQSGTLYDIGCYELETGKSGYFVNNLGAGFDALVAFAANRSQVKKWLNRLGLGKLIYALFLIKEMITFQPQSVDVEVDGETTTFANSWFVTVSNQIYYGGGMKIAPQASPSDGLLDVTIVHDLSKSKLLIVFISVFFGKHTTMKEVTALRGKQIVLMPQLPWLIHTDGEMIGYTPTRIKVKQNSWKLYR